MARKGYHHGNLKQALIDSTIQLIEEKGPTGFTMSEAAKLAGVSAAAPYRHFEGREALIAEVAREGFGIFGDLMEFAYAKGNTPLAALESTGRAYQAFAKKHSGHYIAMFESGVAINSDPDLAAVANRALGVLVHACEELIKDLPAHRRPPATMVSQHIWAMSHGVVELFARGEPGQRSPFSPEDLMESGLGIYLRGLGVLPNDD
ncbi:TetR family transcriptional regulator [Amylibacter kogurei]|uniref:TetR family transcriptional regulator n=1 Tax=Paramylibacter kogurei TaxID=1889778 RepID=A0A2G5K6E4_9RHOB|nr:TetR/AcrR family transcriptional regulator [Amylibacter kogurei]PIB25117.1 TetR family transcriptional regulator [Amylibacter kogurei]